MTSYVVTVVMQDGAPVVTQADPVIWISPQLWAEIQQWPEPRRSGDVVSFGTEGRGLGLLRYRDTGRFEPVYGYRILDQVIA